MYNYTEEKKTIFYEKNQIAFLKIRDNCKYLLKLAGCATMGKIITGCTGDSFLRMACVDRLIELGEIKEITKKDVPGQYRVFIPMLDSFLENSIL